MKHGLHILAAASLAACSVLAQAQDSAIPHPWDGVGLPSKLYPANDLATVVYKGSSLFDDTQRTVLVKRLQADGGMRANCASVESVDVQPKPANLKDAGKDYDAHLGAVASSSQELWTVRQCGFKRYYVVTRQARAGDKQTYHMAPLLDDPTRPAVVVLPATDTAPAVTEGQIRDEYERWTTLLSTTEYKVRHILCETQPQAQTALDRVNAGEDFAKVATELSKDKGSAAKGGDLGWSAASVFVPEFSEAMKGLAPKGVVKAPVSTKFGWHVIEVTEVRQPPPPVYKDVKDRIAQLLRKRSLAAGRPPAS